MATLRDQQRIGANAYPQTPRGCADQWTEWRRLRGLLDVWMQLSTQRDGYYTSADTSTFAEIDETDIPELEVASGALLVAVVSAPRVRDFIFYTDNPQQFLDSAGSLRSRYPQFEIGCECNPDPDWAQYNDLPPAQSQNG